MRSNPEIERRIAKRALALTRAGMLAPDREFMNIVEPGWDDLGPNEEEVLRTRLALDLAPVHVEVYFGHDGRVTFKDHPSGATAWITVRGGNRAMTRAVERGLAQVARKAAHIGESDVDAETRRAADRAVRARLIAELLPQDVVSTLLADGRVRLEAATNRRIHVHTYGDGENARKKINAALARLKQRIVVESSGYEAPFSSPVCSGI